MKRHQRLELLAELGQYLLEEPDEALQEVILRSYQENRWFTEGNIHQALQAIAETFLDPAKLEVWVAQYSLSDPPHPEKTIGLVMAGNIPLVGFHDWLCVFVAGQRSKIKLSAKDRLLLPFLVKKLGDWAFETWEYTEFLGESDKLQGFDAVIATGSNNTARYFEEYFGKYQHVIRRNRNAVAVLDGKESQGDLYALGRDIFSYFGLGCRNVSKLYVPQGYDFDPLLEALHEYRGLIHHDKYKNNFDYNFTLFIMNQIPHLNNGCLLLREDASLQARIASVHYSFYGNQAQLEAELALHREEIQCVASKMQLQDWQPVAFGQTQSPGLADYPDGVDIMDFLTKLKH